MRTSLRLGFVFVAVLGACDPADTTDAGPEGDAGPDAAVAPVSIPWLDRGVPDLMLTPCPEGWREVVDADDGITTCDAYPEGGPEACDFGEAHFPGEAGCRPIGSPCPAGEWPADLPADESTIVFVRAGATGGDGSRASPFGALSEVPWNVRGPGWTIALAKGRYEGTIPLRGGATLVGACVAETTITTSSTDARAVVDVQGAGATATVRDVAIVEAPIRGLDVGTGGNLAIEGVLVDRATELGLFVEDLGSVGTASDLVITDTQARADGYFGYGISVEGGPTFTGTRMVLTGNHDTGLFAQHGPGGVTITDTAISGTRPRVADGTNGRAINAQNDVSLSAERIWLHENRDVSFLIINATATLTDAVITDTLSLERDATEGRAIGIQEGAVVDARRVSIARSRDVAVMAAHEGSALTLTDVVVRDTDEQESDLFYGRGVNIQEHAHLDATRLLVRRSHNVGIFVTELATATLEDVAVHDTSEQAADGHRGSGVTSQHGASIDADRLLISRSREGGVSVVAGSFDGRDVAVRETRRSSCECPERVLGYGMATAGGNLTLQRFWASESDTCGLFVADQRGENGNLDATDGRVENNTIGACVQVPDYSLERITREVEYENNTTNLDSTSLPVPEPLLAL